jgi:hypothetical protein
MTSNNNPGTIATALAPYESAGVSNPSNVIPFPAPTTWPDGWSDWKKTAALKDLVMESAGDGIEPEKPPLDFPAVRRGCAFINEAVETHGKDFDQTRWRYTTLMATAFEGGQELAHEMAAGHPGYTRESTDEMWRRSKGNTEGNPKLAWVGCDKIQAAGYKSCATCPHLGKGKSPLHLGLPTAARVRSGQWPDWAAPLDFREVPIDEAVARVNAAGYFVLTLNGDIYKIELDGGVTVQKREGFTNVFACRQARTQAGALISAGTAWKSSPDRSEYERIGYWPNNHGCPAKSYNLWQRWGIEPVPGDCSMIEEHIADVIADGDKHKANYILDWSGHMVQRPWEKPGVALVMKGRKGTGKTLLTQILARIVGRPNTLITASGKKLFHHFNWHLADKLLIGAEEAFFVGNHEVNDQLKHLLTGDDIEVEQKFGQRLSMKSMHRITMTSNRDQVVAASDDERRFFVCDVSDKRRGDDNYFAPLVRVIKGEDDETLGAFMHLLQTRNIDGWKPEAAARNAAGIDLARQKLLSLEPPLQWLLELTQSDSRPPYDAERDGPNTRLGIADEVGRGKPTNLPPSDNEWERSAFLERYRSWAKAAQIRGATEFCGAEMFWHSIKRVLNEDFLPGQRLFRSSGGKRLIDLQSRQGRLDAFNRLLGGKVVGVDENL